MSLRSDINKAIREGSILGVSFVHMHKYQWVLERLAQENLKKGTQSLNKVWLWEEFNEPYESFEYDDSISKLETVLSKSEEFWFVASDEGGKYWVLKGTGEGVVSLLKNMYFFEYYIINNEFDWLLCENHHGLVIAKGTIINELKYA